MNLGKCPPLLLLIALVSAAVSCNSVGTMSRETNPNPGGTAPGTGGSPGMGGPGSGSGGGSLPGIPGKFEVNLVRLADLTVGQAAFNNIGADSLAQGEVKVEPEEGNRAQVEVKGAMPNVTYDVKFCSFATGLVGCFDIGSLATNEEGEGELEVPFPKRGTFAGDFLLERMQNQFVSGFTIPSNAEAEREGEGEDVFEVGLEPVAAVQGGLGATFTPVGNDPLNEGKVQIEGQGQGEVEVKGAAANVTYMVNFCPFGLSSNNCFMVTTLSTNNEGEGQAEFTFPAGTFTGVFVLTRSMTTQIFEFVTGFNIP